MSTNIVLIARNRPRLTEQCLRTLYIYTNVASFNLTVCDDASDAETQRIIERYGQQRNAQVLRFARQVGIVGYLRNVGAWSSERTYGRGDHVYFSDNDVAFKPGWLDAMLTRSVGLHRHFISGGYQHPYHATNRDLTWFHETDAVAGYSHLMPWHTWDEFGPYDANAKGVCQSEDYALCRRVAEAGGAVGYVHRPVLWNCGLTNSEGKPAVGSEAFPRERGLIYE